MQNTSQIEICQKSTRQTTLSKANILNVKIAPRNTMKINFSKVVFTVESGVTFSEPVNWGKGQILSDTDVPVKKTSKGAEV